jgi:predicted extracellular nuclease
LSKFIFVKEKFEMKRLNRLIALILLLALMPAPFSVSATTSELFFSEYVEGGSYNKALEIFNATGAAVDLSTYTLELYTNGASSASKSVALSGMLTDGDVFVIAHASADAAILAQADQIDPANNVINFNGDDALVLKNGTVVIDVIGEVGFDPGYYWGSGSTTTKDHSLRRMETVCSGDVDWTDPFDPALEWDGFAKDTFDGLGTHTANCNGAADTAPYIVATTPANAAAGVSIDANIGITFSEAVDVIDPWYGIECSVSGAHTAAASGGPTTFNFNPDDDFYNSETCTVTVIATQVTDRDDLPDNMVVDYSFSFDIVTPLLVTPIYDIQYTTDPSGDSPLKDQPVATEGIVTAVFSGGYFVEDSAGGPWSGLWVYDSNTPSIGDFLHLTGKVVEYYGLTELADLTEYVVQSMGNSLPGPDVVASGDVSQEQWEGVLVKVESATVTNPDSGFGEWLVSDGSGDVIIDDKGSYTYTPALGDPLAYVIGALDFSYGSFKIQPRDNSDIKLSLCGNPATSIYTVQGDGFASPIDGDLVDVEGIVTGDFQDGKDGFTIQDSLGDGDTATSDGIFIYSTFIDVSVGDHVRVTGYVDEYYELTEITGVSHLEICSTGNVIAATHISLPVLETGDLEAYEGMLVTFPQSLYISEYYNFARYGEIVLSTDRQFQPTSIYEPGSTDAAQMLAVNLLSRIKLDDGRSWQNPDPALHPNGSIFDLENLFRGGDVLNNLTGVVDYNYGEYKIQPTMGADYVSVNPRTAQPDNVGGNLKVASFNVLNYFTTLGSRGADTALEFTRQRDKIFAALAAMDADVVGLIEIENNTAAIQNLVEGLNALVGAGTYAYVDTGVIGGDEIKVAFIYNTGTVSLVGDYAVLDSSVDSRFIDTKNRPALAQSFMDNTTGGIFTAVVNHLKSKGSPCEDIGDPDLGDGAGNCNLTRTSAAEALVEWLGTDPTNSGDADFLIIGDLNAYDKEDPIDAILAGGYDDLVFHYLGENAYSYVYDGQLGYLDHALANGALASQITGATVWHINADEASLIDYDMSYKKAAQDAIYAPDAYRSSDHDPVLVGLNVCDEIAPTMEITLTAESLWPANHKYVDVTATVITLDNFDPNPVVTLLSVTSSELDDEPGDGDGSTVDDIVIIDDYTFQLRAERSATNKDGRIYTITYQVEDACGNLTVESVTVLVPFSQKK